MGSRIWQRHRRAAASVLIGVSLLAAAYQPVANASVPPGSSAESSSAGAGGDLRIGANLAIGVGLVLDPRQAIYPTYLGITSLIYGTPLISVNGEYQPYLVESYEVVDSSTVVLKLRPGMTFQDGQPYDAQALADGLIANRDSDTPLNEQAIMDLIASFDVVSPTELRITTTGANAGRIPPLLATTSAMVSAPGSDGSVGAGPYRVASFTAGSELVLDHWDGFFDAANYPLAHVTYVNMATGEAAQNALRAGQVDLIAAAPADVDALVGSGDFDMVVTNNEGHYYLSLCRSTPPFDQLEVRQAVDYAINRDQLNEYVMGGYSEPMTQQWPSASPFRIDTDIPTSGDQDRARQLLDSVGGYSGTIPFAVYSGVQNQPRLLEVVQAQLADVGLNVEIIPVTGVVKDTITPESGGGLIIGNTDGDTEKVLNPLLDPNNRVNACNGEDAGLSTLMEPLVAGDLSADERADAWHAAEQYLVDNALIIPLVSQPAVYVFDSTRVQGLRSGTFGLTGATVPSMFLDGVSIIGE